MTEALERIALRKRLRELFDRDLTIREAAKEMGWPVGQLAGAWWRMGLRRRAQHLTPAEVTDRRRQYAVIHLKDDEPKEEPFDWDSPPRPKAPWQARFVNPEDRKAGR